VYAQLENEIEALSWPSIDLELINDQLNLPVHITNAGDGTDRLFVVEQNGKIRIIEGTTLLSTAFLDITDRVVCCGERGLLSVAFPPAYDSKGYFYVNYTRKPDGATVISRFYRDYDDLNQADPDSEQILLVIDQPYSNHNGGQMAFGPEDGYLYIGTGDGGSGGDPQNYAQSTDTLLGKLLRIDVESTAAPLHEPQPTPVPTFGIYLPIIFRSNGQPYLIPPDNPFVGQTGYRPEIWALGLRNPWRFSFDALTGDLYIGDVGQGNWEEIDYQASSSPGGENYGWKIMEGAHCYDQPTCDTTGLVLPIWEYDHSLGCSVTGGHVHRGTSFPDLIGLYLYGDYCSGRIWALAQDGGTWQSSLLLDTAYTISTFGEDEAGNSYLTDYFGGSIYQIIPAAAP
jgi:glucose/arabinose dehydrogenase